MIDYYLTSGQEFSTILKQVDANRIYMSLQSKETDNLDKYEIMADNPKKRIIQDAENQDGFNEKLLKLMCLNQAIGKIQKELKHITKTRDAIISTMEDQIESEKLDNLIKQMKLAPNAGLADFNQVY